MHQAIQISDGLLQQLSSFFSLQGLLSSVDDLLNKLLESEDTYLLSVYIGSVMPNDSEWEKMRQSLPMQVCLKLEHISLILKFGFHRGLNIFVSVKGK